MKVYLAGKMDAANGAWRDEILGTCWQDGRRGYGPRWEIVRKIDGGYTDDDLNVADWPREPNTNVLGIHEYVGPYRQTYAPVEPESKHSGYFHGSTAWGQHGMMNPEEQAGIVGQCLSAIKRADMVFAYLNRPDCFGTIAEIGYAKSVGVYVHVAIDEDSAWEWSDYWFVNEMVDQVTSMHVRHSIHCSNEYGRMFVDHSVDTIDRIFRDAIVSWTGRPPKRPALSVVSDQAIDDSRRALEEIERRFGGWVADIARWTSDPRVRDEALRMTRSLKTGGGRR